VDRIGRVPADVQLRRRAAQLLWSNLPAAALLRLRPIRPELEAERLTILLRALAQRREGRGAIVEIGCYRGGTALEANRLLKIWGAERRYVCLDTFEGFVDQQFSADEKEGTPSAYRHSFDVNSRRALERVARHLGYDRIEVVEGDITRLPEGVLPGEISVALIDVDLSEPTFVGLQKLYPRLVPGGVLFVDDCHPGGSGWQAAAGYSRFCAENGLEPLYDAGFGVVHAPASARGERRP
jgi:predicted O-methyltransferase YrrM